MNIALFSILFTGVMLILACFIAPKSKESHLQKIANSDKKIQDFMQHRDRNRVIVKTNAKQ